MRRVVLGGIGRPRDRRQPLLPVDDNYFCRCGDLAQAFAWWGGADRTWGFTGRERRTAIRWRTRAGLLTIPASRRRA
jgi:hypothetical protein